MHNGIIIEGINTEIILANNRKNINMKLSFWKILLLVLLPAFAYAQPTKLAQQYYRTGEYEKAASLYQKLYKEQPYSDVYFSRYFDCLVLLENYKEAEKVLKSRIKQKPNNPELYVNYGNLYERQFKEKEAEEQFVKAIDQLPKERYQIIRLANSFIKLTKYDLALKTYEKGGTIFKDKYLFAYELGDLYRRKGDSKPMVTNYLNSLEQNPTRLASMKTLFQRYLTDDDFKELQIQLYDKIREDPKSTTFPEMLTWLFIQRKDYKNALRQVRAMDKRLKENGGRVYQLAQTAYRDKDYETAIKAYEYIVANKGERNTYYLESKREILKCKRFQLVAGYQYSKEDLKILEGEYESFLNEFGRNKTTASMILELAELEALYINDLDKSIELLDEMINYPGIARHVQAKGKLALADYYLMQGERWESTLLYSQVDKAFKDDVLGQTARFKNAKLSYYTSEFEWAQSQFKVLKASTSKLIANDALDLSVFILDNLGLDTTSKPMAMYAQADLLVFQNRLDEAFAVLDSIRAVYPKHSLDDDILYTKAQIYMKQRNLPRVVEMYETIINTYPESIRLDNSIFALAQLYENQLNDLDKAKELYKKIILEHSDSTFAVEARKRFRTLRGEGYDNVQE